MKELTHNLAEKQGELIGFYETQDDSQVKEIPGNTREAIMFNLEQMNELMNKLETIINRF